MTQGFQQQDHGLGYTFTKSAPSPQHGQKGAALALPVRPPRPKPRPGH